MIQHNYGTDAHEIVMKVFIHVESHEMVDVDMSRKADLEWSQDSTHASADVKHPV